ncbi:MAG TPA: hypothetical protein DIU15_10955 [Deltaproteobacteria bacterium]|nr:hypothetical protein [Deltaproteobacteria bacterium]HCP46556.1 hypothetical protein [Deltaproteobacteria bacterium]
MSDQQSTKQGWAVGALAGLVLGLVLGMHLAQDASPSQELGDWVEAGFSEEESRILVAYGRTQLLPSEIRRLAQGGEPKSKAAPSPSRRASSPSSASTTKRPNPSKANAASTQRRLLQGCQALQAGKHTSVDSWFTAMRAQGNPWSALANRVQTEVPPDQQVAALKDAWNKLCTPRKSQ